jgi:DNA-binding PadR family transcriptional regulator
MPRKPKPEVKPTRATRRVLLVLLTGAGKLGGFTITRAAMVNSGTVHVVLAKLERAGWVTSEWDQHGVPATSPRRRFYELTAYGRARALALLGLEAGRA